jgi:Ca-activated chloride channel homolog
MDRRSALRSLAAGGAVSFLTGFSRSGPPHRAPQDSLFRSEALLVLLDVSVKDNRGHFVPGLTRDNFTVLEDGQPQTVTVFDSEDRPVTMGLLLDESRSMTLKRREVIAAARALIEESNRLDEVFVLHFNDRVSMGLPAALPFSSDRKQLLAALSREVPGGKTALYDGLWEGMKHLRLGRRDKKCLVLISDGGDTASRRRRPEMFELTERSTATIYAIGLHDPEDPDRDPGFLRRLAKTSGGEAYLPSGTEEMLGLCRQIAKEIRTRYTVGYIPKARRGRKSFHNLEVRARDPQRGRLHVLTRSGYRSDEEGSS